MTKERESFIQKLDEIYRDILSINISCEDSFRSSVDKFYEVMRKYGIKHGRWTNHGSRTVVNVEWNMCWQVFREHKIKALDVWLLLSDPPEDLLAYGKQPKNKK